ncbi:protein Abitram isoform X2 [Nematostella vectensis]|uniref:protein Abitram isoform X2 n=1 Tax=Nematostella vectensis TaxID=45351 RepID=UPI0020779756|nr:protein Abitram isoform X2 [Nematostella vectensis]
MADEVNATVPSEATRKTVVDRYFSRGYMTDVNGRCGEDQCVLLHSNKICVVTVSPEHPLVKEKCAITSINFQISSKINRLDNHVSGKSKKGAQWMMPDDALCEVTCSNGTTYTLNSCIKGKLVEINQELLKTPELIKLKPETDGFIAVVLPKLTEVNEYFDKLLSPESYHLLLDKRKLSEQGVTPEGHANEQNEIEAKRIKLT